jgi:hypothetical protein
MASMQDMGKLDLEETTGHNQGRRTPGPLLQNLGLGCLWGVAILLRLGDLAARNLWTDEAWVALAALAPTPGAALTLGRSTPPLYVLTVWGLAQGFGGGEAVLRSLSFAFGVGVVFLFWGAARRLARPAAAFLGLALVAVSPVLVYFSKELKQYSGDAFFAVLLVWLAERLKERPGRRSWLTLALAGPLALGFSHGAVFVLPVVLGVLWLALDRPQRPRVMYVGAFWGLALAAFYFGFIRGQVDPMLLDYWSGDFPDLTGVLPFLIWLAGALGRYGHYFFSSFFWADWGWLWGVGSSALGLMVLAGTGPRRLLAYWGGPLLLALAAACLHRYPFMGHFNGSRLLLFSAPWLYLLAATGLTAALAWLWRRPQRWLAPVLAGLILITTQPRALVQEDLSPRANRQALQPLTAYLQDHILPGDQIYVYFHAIYPFKYYYRGDQDGVLWGKTCVESHLTLPGSPRRVWLMAAHFQDLNVVRQFAARLLGPEWREEATVPGQNAALLLFVPQGQAALRSGKVPPGPPQSGSAAPPGGKACRENPWLPQP